MEYITKNSIGYLTSESYQDAKRWDSPYLDYLIYKLPVCIIGGFIGAILVYLILR